MPRSAAELTHAEQLARLRKRCAASENIETLRRIAEDAQELSWIAPDSLDVGAFVDRLRDKIGRLAPSKDTTKPKRQAAQVSPTGRGASMSPAIDMRISEWTIDEHGNRSRVAWNRADGAVPP
jgi:hypothetical protein